MFKPGVHFEESATRFVLRSRHAQQIELLLFDDLEADQPTRVLPMQRDGTLWHLSIPEVQEGTGYLYRATGRPPAGKPNRFQPDHWLLDPWATRIHWPRRWSEPGVMQPGQPVPLDRTFPKGIVTTNRFDWEGDAPPRIPPEQTVIYEAHLRGFTDGGTYLDFIEKIPYLQELGITAVEFLPLFEFNEMEFFLEGGPRRNLLNFWGYSTLGFFAPMARYAADPTRAADEFRTLVKALHRAGIEVILDVVFNHTGEGPENGPVWSFRGLDDPVWYLQQADGTYYNFSGCGNTFNANHPIVREFIVDCLRYWVREMHVDGFRFDLASALTRDRNGKPLKHPPLFRKIESDPLLKKVKLIAEAWDAVGLYQVGHFPASSFSDWNGRFRDEVRAFWRGDPGTAGALATRLCGSEDLYGHRHEGPVRGINFITAHDGFTLYDLTAYAAKHNEANAEENRDGENHNLSCNHGMEGPSSDPVVEAARLRHIKNLLATLFLSRGVPMLTAGDEFARSQQGNNNAYCQDNEIGWIDWSRAKQSPELTAFTRRLITLRKKYPALHRNRFHTAATIQWFGPDNTAPDWLNGMAFACVIENHLALLVNNTAVPQRFALPEADWRLELCTADETAQPPATVPPHALRLMVLPNYA